MTETTMTTAPVKESSMKKKEPRFILSPSSCSSHSGTNRARVSNVRWVGRHTSEEPGLALATRHPRGLRVTRTNGSRIVLDGVQRKSLKDRLARGRIELPYTSAGETSHRFQLREPLQYQMEHDAALERALNTRRTPCGTAAAFRDGHEQVGVLRCLQPVLVSRQSWRRCQLSAEPLPRRWTRTSSLISMRRRLAARSCSPGAERSS